MAEVTCIDCLKGGVETVRPTPHGGPRSPLCVTHWRERKKVKRAKDRERRLAKFGLLPEDEKAILEYQGGTCWVCGVANGKTKALAIDHDHETGQVRCIACGRCNFELLGRYDVPALKRAIEILEGFYPAERALGRKVFVLEGE